MLLILSGVSTPEVEAPELCTFHSDPGGMSTVPLPGYSSVPRSKSTGSEIVTSPDQSTTSLPDTALIQLKIKHNQQSSSHLPSNLIVPDPEELVLGQTAEGPNNTERHISAQGPNDPEKHYDAAQDPDDPERHNANQSPNDPERHNANRGPNDPEKHNAAQDLNDPERHNAAQGSNDPEGHNASGPGFPQGDNGAEDSSSEYSFHPDEPGLPGASSLSSIPPLSDVRQRLGQLCCSGPHGLKEEAARDSMRRPEKPVDGPEPSQISENTERKRLLPEEEEETEVKKLGENIQPELVARLQDLLPNQGLTADGPGAAQPGNRALPPGYRYDPRIQPDSAESFESLLSLRSDPSSIVADLGFFPANPERSTMEAEEQSKEERRENNHTDKDKAAKTVSSTAKVIEEKKSADVRNRRGDEEREEIFDKNEKIRLRVKEKESQKLDVKEPRNKLQEQKKQQEIVLYKYQKELAEPGLQDKNCIICTPTGSGKTITASHICRLKHDEALQKGKRFKALFIVCIRNLIQQQTDALRKVFDAQREDQTTNEGSVVQGIKDTESLKVLLEKFDIVVLTAQILVNALWTGEVKFTQFDLLILDECHHTDQGHPYNAIMRNYHDMKRKDVNAPLPQVIGLTASLGVGSGEDNAWNHYIRMCANLDATCITHVRDQANYDVSLKRFYAHALHIVWTKECSPVYTISI